MTTWTTRERPETPSLPLFPCSLVPSVPLPSLSLFPLSLPLPLISAPLPSTLFHPPSHVDAAMMSAAQARPPEPRSRKRLVSTPRHPPKQETIGNTRLPVSVACAALSALSPCAQCRVRRCCRAGAAVQPFQAAGSVPRNSCIAFLFSFPSPSPSASLLFCITSIELPAAQVYKCLFS